MKVFKRGEGEPEYSVVGLLHGDEKAGKEAIERFLRKEIEFKKPVKFVIANEEAFEKGVRFLDDDLNRSFPGDSESESHEERLAAEVLRHVEGTKVLDLHTTKSYPEPFATFTNFNETVKQLLRYSGVEYAVHFPQDSGTLNGRVDGIIVEAGLQESEEAVENAVEVIENFLAAEGVIEADYATSSPEVFRYQEQVDGDWDFLAENFKKVEKGQKYAEKNGEAKIAEEDFYPVLMSSDGYEGMLGFKARKVGKI
jgi:predicted deacylase